jgi:hypothetical protein
MMAVVGALNDNSQRLLAKTRFKGNGPNALIWAVQCERDGCGHVYGANGHDFHLRLCPKCQGGAEGL